MTVIISVKTNDGIVMASDSASTFSIGQTYLHADKIVNLIKGKPIGVMVTGSGSVGSESVSTLFKDLRARLDGSAGHDWALGEDYTIEQIAQRVRTFLFEEKVQQQGDPIFMLLKVCGYSSGRPLAEIWEVRIQAGNCEAPTQILGENRGGIRWDGEYEPLNRLLLGMPNGLSGALIAAGIPEAEANAAAVEVPAHNTGLLYLDAMPIQDAIDLARWLVQVTMGYQRFNVLQQPKTVGGSIELAAITKHEGFRWIERRHFYSAELNPHG
jgi:hypothetical protein